MKIVDLRRINRDIGDNPRSYWFLCKTKVTNRIYFIMIARMKMSFEELFGTSY